MCFTRLLLVLSFCAHFFIQDSFEHEFEKSLYFRLSERIARCTSHPVRVLYVYSLSALAEEFACLGTNCTETLKFLFPTILVNIGLHIMWPVFCYLPLCCCIIIALLTDCRAAKHRPTLSTFELNDIRGGNPASLTGSWLFFSRYGRLCLCTARNVYTVNPR